MSDDLIRRLRDWFIPSRNTQTAKIIIEAADTIERLERELAEARKRVGDLEGIIVEPVTTLAEYQRQRDRAERLERENEELREEVAELDAMEQETLKRKVERLERELDLRKKMNNHRQEKLEQAEAVVRAARAICHSPLCLMDTDDEPVDAVIYGETRQLTTALAAYDAAREEE